MPIAGSCTRTIPVNGVGAKQNTSCALVSIGALTIVVHPYATISVKARVAMTLTMRESNYTKWASFFKLMCGKFGIKPHIDSSMAPRSTHLEWDQSDCYVRN